MAIIMAEIENKNNKLKRLFQSINNNKIKNQHNRITYILCPCVNSLITNSKYFRIWYKNNKNLVLLIDRIKILIVYDTIEILVPINYFRNIITN